MRLNIGIDGPVGAGKSTVADAVAAKLKDQSADAAYTMTLNNEMIGTAKLNSDGTEAVITADNTVGDITQVASKIRGLA